MDGIKWIKVTNENFDIYGVDENFKRMSTDISEGISGSVATLSRQSAGGRIRLTTNFSRIYVRAYVAAAGMVGFDVYRMANVIGPAVEKAIGLKEPDVKHDCEMHKSTYQKTAKKEEVLWRISAFRSQESSAV